MAECTTCSEKIDLTVPNDGYRCAMCNSTFCKQHANNHFGNALQRAEKAEQELEALRGR